MLSPGAAFVRKIMDLTPEQLEPLAADQKAQIIAMQTRM